MGSAPAMKTKRDRKMHDPKRHAFFPVFSPLGGAPSCKHCGGCEVIHCKARKTRKARARR